MPKSFLRVMDTDFLSACGLWIVVYAALWALLAGNEGWTFGLPSIVFATLLAVFLRPHPWSFYPLELPAFLLFFFRSTFMGALDVARRPLYRHCPIRPAWVWYSFRETDPRVRLLTSAIVGLFPGTLASKIQGDDLCLHILDERGEWHGSVAELEARLGKLLLGKGAGSG